MPAPWSRFQDLIFALDACDALRESESNFINKLMMRQPTMLPDDVIEELQRLEREYMAS